jgi:hypothetical protein
MNLGRERLLDHWPKRPQPWKVSPMHHRAGIIHTLVGSLLALVVLAGSQAGLGYLILPGLALFDMVLTLSAFIVLALPIIAAVIARQAFEAAATG